MIIPIIATMIVNTQCIGLPFRLRIITHTITAMIIAIPTSASAILVVDTIYVIGWQN